jgi:HEAT repeat protein
VRADGWADAISGREVTRIGTPQFGMLGEQKFELRHASTTRIEAGWPDGLETVAVDAIAANAQADEVDDQQLVDGATLSDLLAAIAQTTDDQARGYQFMRLGALLRLDANSIDEAARAIAAKDPAAMMLISALGEAGTPRAQAALARMLDGSVLDDHQREQAAVALGLTDAPTDGTFDALARASRREGDAGNTALLALGNAALRAADDNPAEAARRVDELLAQLARTTSDEERALVLRALGNTGDVRILAAVASALASGSVPVRIAATEALRLVPGSEALIASALRDRVADVRAAAVFACAERDLAALAAPLATVVQREPEVQIRRAVIELAGDHAALRSLLVHAAARDSDRELRELAARLLSELDAA